VGQYEDALLSMQHIASLNASGILAVNMSWGKLPRGGDVANGNSLLSLGLDYLAQQHDALFVMSKGNASSPGELLPKDSYNGLVLGSTGST